MTRLLACSLVAAALAVPLAPAHARDVSISVETPDFGFRVGAPYPEPVYPLPVYRPRVYPVPIYPTPVYPAPIYAPPVYAPRVVVAPVPVYLPVTRYVYAPVTYREGWHLPPGHAKKYWKAKHFRPHDWDD